MNTPVLLRVVRRVAVRIFASFMIVLLVLPGPLEAIARAQASQRALRAAARQIDRISELDTDVETLAAAQAAAGAPERSRPPAAALASAVLPVPLRPAGAAWLSPAGAAGDPWVLFDGRATTALQAVTSDPVQIGIVLEAPTELAAITLLGPADGTLSVRVEQDGAARSIESLARVSVHARSGEWKRFAVPEHPRAQKLVLQWMPSAPAGPSEIGLWGLGLPRRARSDTEMADRILSGAAFGGTSVTANPAEAHIARVALGPAGPASPDRPAVFRAMLAADPRSFARAFLVYELTGLGHFTEAIRQINGGEPRGGKLLANSEEATLAEEGGLQVEEIAPEWLHAGTNELRFLPLPSAGSPDYAVRNVRIVGTGHANVVEARLSQGRGQEQRLELGGPAQPHDLVFELLKPSEGNLAIRPDNGRAPFKVDLRGLTPGWHRTDLDHLGATASLAIALETKRYGRSEDPRPVVSEVAVTASELARAADEDGRIVVSYPLHGECVAHTAQVRGFVKTAAGDEVSVLRANGQAIDDALSRDRSFVLSVAEPRVAVGHSWDVALEAGLTSGRVLRRTVHIAPCLDAKGAEGGADDQGAPFGEVVRAGERKTISFAGAELEIPEGAVERDVRITVRPLVRAQVPQMDPLMRNVSPDRRAFRFGPHGLKFKRPVKITLPFEPSLISAGMREEEIYSFYYDEKLHKWEKIGRFGTAHAGALVSLSEHFTDFVIATLAKPDEPGVKSYNPNDMKGIKLASPSAGIDLIAPPEPNNSGAANLRLAVEVPPGRNGIEPDLAFTYSSEKQNGWLGVGWDLRVSSFEIDTRFGVPKYDGTERYLFDGEELTPAPNQSSPPTFFLRRVEGRFDQIARNLDANGCVTSWTLTDKHGTVFTFGGPGAVLADPNNGCHVFRWGLSQVQDTFGNQMQISYFLDKEPTAGTEPFRQLYPDTILYTGHTSHLAPAYKVQLLRDNGTRKDAIVNGRPGFQEKTRFRLDHVDVFLEQAGSTPPEQIIRRYQLSYAADSLANFHKSLVASIALQGVPLNATPSATGTQAVTPTTELDQHTFEYFGANVGSVSTPTGVAQQLAGFGFQQDALGQPWGTSTRTDDGLSRTDDTLGGGSLSLGVGFLFIFSATAGGGANSGGTSTRLAFVDANGDGLPDSIDDTGNGAFNFFRPTLSVPSPVAGHLQPGSVSPGPPGIGHSGRSGWSAQGGLSIGPVGASVSYSNTSTDDDRILADIDGDGLVDVATLNNGVLTWYKNAGPNGFIQKTGGTIIPNGLIPDANLAGQAASASGQTHRIEPLVRWTAPFDGPIQILGTLQKATLGGNGVDVFIFKNSMIVWQGMLSDSGMTSCIPTLNAGQFVCGTAGLQFQVNRGDGVYVLALVHHDPTLTGTALVQELGRETVGNQIQYAPTISYMNAPANSGSLREAYGGHVYQFSQADDFRAYGGAVSQFTASADGQVHVDTSVGTVLAKSTTSDDATATVVLSHTDANGVLTTTTFPSQTLPAGSQSSSTSGFDIPNVSQGDTIALTLTSDTPIDPLRAGWAPVIQYTSYCLVDPASGKDLCGAPNCPQIDDPTSSCTLAVPNSPEPNLTLPAGLIKQVGQVQYSPGHLIYGAPTAAFVAPNAGQFTVSGDLQLDNLSGQTTVLLQGVHRLFQKFPSISGASGHVSLTGTAPLALQANDELFLTVFSAASGPTPAPSITNTVVVNGTQVPVNIVQRDTSFDTPDASGLPNDPMSGGFHGWWTGFFDGETQPFDPAEIPPVPDPNGAGTFSFSPAFFLAFPQAQATPMALWVGSGGANIGSGTLNPTRADTAGSGGAGGGVNSLRHASTWDLNFNASVKFGLSGGFSFSQGETNTDHDFFDFNGDKFPDAISHDGNIQLGDGTGGFAPPFNLPQIAQLPALRRVSHAALGASIGADIKLIHDVDSDGSVRKTLTTGVALGNDYGMSTHQVDWVDVNGDGLPDVVQRQPGGGSDFQVLLNYGNGLSGPVTWTSGGWLTSNVDATGVGSVIGSDNVTHLFQNFADVGLNGVRTQDSGTNMANLGGEFGTQGVSVGAGAGFSFNVTRQLVDMVDINGDGLPDQVMKRPDEDFVRVRFNLGDQFDTSEVLWPLPEWNLNIDTDKDNFGYSAVDLGTINQSLSFRRSKTFNVSFSAQVCFFLCVGGSGFYSSGNSWVTASFEDMDGDGLPDMVFKARNGNPVYVKRNLLNEPDPGTSPPGQPQPGPVRPINRLSVVHRPLGGNFALTYAREGNLVRATPRTDEPTNRYVLAKVDVDDGRNNHYVRTFQYTPTGIYDRIEREDYGFAQVTTTREDNSTVEVDYDNGDFYRKGLVSQTFARDTTGALFTSQSFTYADPAGTPQLIGFFFPSESSRTTSSFEGTAQHKDLVETRTWDPNGNLKTLTDAGDAAPGAGQISYQIDYDTVLAAAHIFRPSRVSARDSASNIVRDRQATYFPTGALQTLTNVISGGTDPSGAPYTGNRNLAWSFSYDPFGNVQQAKDPTGYQLNYLYDTIAQTYRIQTTDSFTYSSTSAPDFRFGTVAMDVDINGNQTLYSYDGFGRLTAVDGPNDIGAGAGLDTISFAYGQQPVAIGTLPSITVPSYATTKHKDVQRLTPTPDPITTVTFVDGLDRIIETKKDIDKTVGATPPQNGMSVSGAIVFDSRGRIAQQGQPVFDQNPDSAVFVDARANGPSCPAPAPPCPINATSFTYDILDRATSVTAPDSTAPGGHAVTTTGYTVANGPDGILRLETIVKDPNLNANVADGGKRPGSTHLSFRDVRGNIVAIQDTNRLSATTPTTLTTKYAYDVLDELLNVKDAKGNVTTATYDSIGRMVTLSSPDAGLTQYRYATTGNLGAKQTANLRALNQAIQYQYDANRLKAIVYPTTTAVTYAYGAQAKKGDGTNSVGRLLQETSEAGSKDFQYDRLGNVVHQHWHLNSLSAPWTSGYDETMSYTYDSFARMLTAQFPGDGKEKVSYAYDHGGNVTGAVGVNTVADADEPPSTIYALSVGYDEFEQRTKLVYGNGIVESYTYDPLTRRLASVNANELDPTLKQAGKPPRAFERMVYSYDVAGNISQIRNDSPFDDLDLAFTLPANVAQNFTYDDLYQLKTSDGVYQEKSNERQKYGLQFTYDAIGNILNKTQTNDVQVPDGSGGFKEFYNVRGQSYTANYTYGSSRPHAASEIDEHFVGDAVTNTRSLHYDADGNQAGWLYQGITDREVKWTEEDRIRSMTLNGVQLQAALYDGSGTREVNLQVPQGMPPDPLEPPDPTAFYETASFGANLTLRNAAFLTRHVYLGDLRLASKMETEDIGPYPTTVYFPGDHLGSTHFLTNDVQDLVAHQEYFPTGELWVDEVDSRYATRMPYLFNGKTLDVATGLYYYGARYYDPHFSQWVSADPALAGYMDGGGAGGVYRPGHLALYTYGFNNPIGFLDPNGLWEVDWRTVGRSAVRGFVIGVAVGAGAALVIASAGAAAPAVAAGFAFAGGFATGVGVGEVVYGVDLHGNQLTDKQRSAVLGEVFGGTVGSAVGGFGVAKGLSALGERGVAPPADSTPAAEPPAAETSPTQVTVDAIHNALEPGSIASKQRTTTINVHESGRVSLTGSRKPTPAQRKVAAEFGITEVPSHGKSTLAPGEAGGHGEARGIQHGINVGDPVAQQLSASGAGHGGKACAACAARQAAHGVHNGTGTQ
jgi:RHS repeat-associated protein